MLRPGSMRRSGLTRIAKSGPPSGTLNDAKLGVKGICLYGGNNTNSTYR